MISWKSKKKKKKKMLPIDLDHIYVGYVEIGKKQVQV